MSNTCETLGNGTYPAKWGGYVINTTIGGKDYEFKTKVGVRGFDIPVKVTYTNDVWTAFEEKYGRVYPLELAL